MAVSLPTIEVTTAQRTKLLAVFPGGANEYAAWLKAALRDEVLRRTARAMDEESNTAKRATLDTLAAELPEA